MKDPFKENKLHKLIKSEALKKEHRELGAVAYWRQFEHNGTPFFNRGAIQSKSKKK